MIYRQPGKASWASEVISGFRSSCCGVGVQSTVDSPSLPLSVAPMYLLSIYYMPSAALGTGETE